MVPLKISAGALNRFKSRLEDFCIDSLYRFWRTFVSILDSRRENTRERRGGGDIKRESERTSEKERAREKARHTEKERS